MYVRAEGERVGASEDGRRILWQPDRPGGGPEPEIGEMRADVSDITAVSKNEKQKQLVPRMAGGVARNIQR